MHINAGDTAWMLTSTALVFFMMPGLALFYGGLVGAKNVIATMVQSFVAIGVISLLWVIIGYSLAFGSDHWGVIGSLQNVMLRGVNGTPNLLAPTIPSLVYMAFQMKFAVITPALIAGAFCERMRFRGYLVFIGLWSLIVYSPFAHAEWGGGFLGTGGLHAIDFAGGSVVHELAGAAALATALYLKRSHQLERPHNVPLVLLGAGILWFGWFGFNAGSELGVDGTTALAFMNTQIATAAAAGGWLLVERYRDGKPTTLGIASGAVAGLVAITPACAFIAPWAAIVLGLLAGALCACAIGIKHRLGFDDALDVVGVHLVGGAFGAVSLGFLAVYPLLDGQRKGLFYGGGFTQLGVQALGPVAVGLYSFTIAWILATIIDKTMGFRVSAEDEVTGVDLTQHAETAYDFGSIHLGHTPGHAVTDTDQEVTDQDTESAIGAR
jgi:ammonium transporter, Amt family